jgi:hypothetical protein
MFHVEQVTPRRAVVRDLTRIVFHVEHFEAAREYVAVPVFACRRRLVMG